MATRKFIDENALSHIALLIKQKYMAKEFKTGSTTDYKVLSDNNLTDELKTKILNAGSSSFTGNYEDLTNKPDLTVFAKSVDVTAQLNAAIANFLTETQIDAKITTATTNMATTSSVATAITTALADYYTKTEVDTKLADYAKTTEVTTAITNALKTYYTKTEVDTAITNATKDFITETAIDTKISTATNDMATNASVTTAINNAVKDITSFNYSIVTKLPATGVKGTIYLIANEGSAPNIYDEYIYVNGAFEKIGTTEIDLSGYQKTADLVPITNEEINTIFNS